MVDDIQPMVRILTVCLISIFLAGFISGENAREQLPAWVAKAGVRSGPRTQRTFSANKFGAKADGETNSTHSIQQAIDECSKTGGGVVTFEKGEYVAGVFF